MIYLNVSNSGHFQLNCHNYFVASIAVTIDSGKKIPELARTENSASLIPLQGLPSCQDKFYAGFMHKML